MNRHVEKKSAREQLEKFIRFATVGSLTGGWYAIVVVVAVRFLDITPPVASAIAYLTAIPLSFVGHKQYTFRSRGLWKLELLRFLIVHAVNLFMSYWSMHVITNQLDYPYWGGIGVCIALVPILTFVLMNTLVFGAATTPEDTTKARRDS